MKQLFNVALLLLAGCASANASDDHLTLSRVGDTKWKASFCFEEPVEALRFERPITGLREQAWRAGPDFTLETEQGVTTLSRSDGQPFTCVEVVMATWTERPEKDYYAFSPFSDGGVSVYTGHMIPSALRGREWKDVSLAARYLPREGETVMTRSEDELVEQFVYFGRQSPLKSEGVVAVVDPAMPSVARQMILEAVPVTNRLLAETFGFRPSSPYTLFMAADLDAFEGHSVKGGALEGQVLFTLKGRGVKELVREHPEHFSKSAVHEVLHLWQVEHWFNTLGNDEPWVHEGAADALAFEILRRGGIYDGEAYRAAWRQAEVDCVQGLRDGSVHDAADAGRFDLVYSCGALLNRLVGEALEPSDPGQGIIRFWQEMAAWPDPERRTDSEALFFRTLEKLHFSREKREALRDFLDLQTEDGASALARLRDTIC